MKRFLSVICLMCAVCVLLAVPVACIADTVYGVLGEERVINLPKDEGKWHISIVGSTDNTQYQTILKWFKTHKNLKTLKSAVHYHPIATNTVEYQARYKANVRGLPTVRFQNAAGKVVYEAAGQNLPFTASGLYGAMANNVQSGPLLRWRQDRRRICPCPVPEPDTDPVPDGDPEPQPLNDGGPPDVIAQSTLPPLWLMLVVLVVSAMAGLVVEWRATYAEK